MDLLILGGGRFVGRSMVLEALARGFRVTLLNRGRSAPPPEGAELLVADRTEPGAVAAATAGRTFDLVLDTWSGAPRVATDTARALAGRAAAYGYVSTCSVYRWGTHSDESSPVVEADPEASTGDYAEVKRGSEMGIQATFPEAVIARAGLILGPHEYVGRLPWWLGRIAEGGRVVAPGRPDRPLQYVDARDLAAFLIDASLAGRTGAVDVISRSGHATTAALLEACVAATGSDAELVWVEEEDLAAAGAEPWTHLPCWVPESGDTTGFLESDTSRAESWGLRCRPVQDTVGDTWNWMQRNGPQPRLAGVAEHGLPREIERALLG